MNIYDLIDPVETTLIARQILAEEDRPENAFALSRWFPSQLVDGIDYEYDAGSNQSYTDAMPFRAWTTEAPLGRMAGRRKKSGEIPPLSKKYMLTEYDLQRLTRAVAQGGEAGDAASSVIAFVEAGIRSLRNRMELAMGEALAFGTTTLAENGVQLDIDWGRDAGAEDTVANNWSDTVNATPLADEEGVMDALGDRTGLGPESFVAVMGRTTWRQWKATEQVQNAYNSVRVLPTLSVDQANEVRRDADLPDVVVYRAQTNDVNGNLVPVIPADKVLYLPRNFAVGATQWGVPTVALAGDVELEADQQPGPVAYMMKQLDPLITYTVIDAVGLPTFADTDATHVLDVVA